MSVYEPRVGAIGVTIRIDMQEDVSAATYIKFIVIKPGQITEEWGPITVYSANVLQYLVEPGDFDVSGIYRITPYFRLGAWEGKCKEVSFLVYN